MSVGDNALSILRQIRQTSNEKACANFETRIDNIKIAMRTRNAPQQQFDELDKIERIYLEIVNGNNYKSEKLEKKEDER